MAHVEATKLDAGEETHHYELQRTRPPRLTRKKRLTRPRECDDLRLHPDPAKFATLEPTTADP